MYKIILAVLLVPTVFVTVFLLAGCNKASLLNATVSGSAYKLQKDVVYGDHSRAKLDIYKPKKPLENAPLVMFVYGGSWQEGSKKDYLFAAQGFAAAGYTTLVPDYRVYPEVIFPTFVQDIAAAVAWSQRQSFDGTGKPQKVVLVGHSAGAQISMLLNLDQRYLAEQGLNNCSAIAGVIGLAGPYDFLPLSEQVYKNIFPEDIRDQSQAINFANASSPPVLLLAGDADKTVGLKNSRNLNAKMQQLGAQVEFKVYPDVGHVGMVLPLASLFRGRAPVLQDSLSFIKRLGNDPQISSCR